jgi:fluoride exporter
MTRQLPISPENSSFYEKGVSGLPSTREANNTPSHHETPVPESGTVLDSVLARQQSTADERSLASIDRPPLPTELVTSVGLSITTYSPFSPAVIALLMPASIFGTLARLGLQALATYDGESIFPLAYPQALGCFIMGVALPLKDTLSG